MLYLYILIFLRALAGGKQEGNRRGLKEWGGKKLKKG